MKKLLMIAALAACVAAPAEAQNQRATGEVGINAGYVLFDSDALDDDLSFGVHLGLNITDNAEVEVRYDFTNADLVGTDADIDIDAYSLGFVWNFHPGGDFDNPHVPYVTVGGGTADLDPSFFDESGKFTDDYHFLFVGGGYRYFWNDYFGLRWDLRAIFHGDDGDFGETDDTDVQTSIGLTWVFGGGY